VLAGHYFGLYRGCGLSLSLSLSRARWTDTLQKGRSKYEINKFFYSMADTHMRDIYDEVQHYHFRKRGIDRTLVRWAFAVGAENAFCSAVCIQSVLFTKTHSGQTLENLRKRRRFPSLQWTTVCPWSGRKV